MRIATWNVNGMRARQEFLLHWLRSRQPDVVGLQELKLTDEQFPHDQIAAAGYQAVTHAQKAWNGVAILSREQAVVTQAGLPGQEELGARLITAEVEGLSFSTAYFPNGKSTGHEDFPRKLAWLDAIVAHFAAQHAADRPTILCGDFNLCPQPIDSWNEEALTGAIFHTDAERERFQQLLSWGFRDAYRELHPEEQSFSWYDYRGGAFHKNQGLRIDFLLATESAMSRIKSVDIDRDYRKKKDGLIASDHVPIFADLE